MAYLRKGKNEKLLCIHHFSPEILKDYRISLQDISQVREIFNTDSQEYGGYGIINEEFGLKQGELILNLPPLSTLILELC